MKLELPDDHPISNAIRELSKDNPPRMILSLDVLGRHGTAFRAFSYDITAWTQTKNTETRFEVDLLDSAALLPPTKI